MTNDDDNIVNDNRRWATGSIVATGTLKVATGTLKYGGELKVGTGTGLCERVFPRERGIRRHCRMIHPLGERSLRDIYPPI